MPSTYSSIIGVSAVCVLLCRAITPFPKGRFPTLLGLWIIIAASIEITAIALVACHVRTMFLYNLYWPVEFGLLVAIGQSLHPWRKGALLCLVILFGSVWVFDITTIDPFTSLVTRSVICGAFMLTAYYLYQFWKLANTLQGRLREAAAVWLCIAILLYYGASGPLLGSYNYFLLVDHTLARRIAGLTQIACIMKFVLMGICCLRMRTYLPTVAHES